EVAIYVHPTPHPATISVDGPYHRVTQRSYNVAEPAWNEYNWKVGWRQQLLPCCVQSSTITANS
ncbi:MAG: hypothetical protein KDB23_05180, partial [Planctomycetales bacterium]|nr:hypothetical protein [Planctomycetales bacterium]